MKKLDALTLKNMEPPAVAFKKMPPPIWAKPPTSDILLIASDPTPPAAAEGGDARTHTRPHKGAKFAALCNIAPTLKMLTFAAENEKRAMSKRRSGDDASVINVGKEGAQLPIQLHCTFNTDTSMSGCAQFGIARLEGLIDSRRVVAADN